MNKLSRLRLAFIEAAAHTKLRRGLINNAGKITGLTWMAADPLIAVNRSLMNHAVTLDALSIAGGLGLAASALYLLVDRYPVFKKISSAIFLTSVPFFMLDAAAHDKKILMAAGLACPVLISLAILFEKSASGKNTGQGPEVVPFHGNETLGAELKEARVFWISTLSMLTKISLIAYACLSKDYYAIGGMVLYGVCNAFGACTDRTIKGGVLALHLQPQP